jgi:hypothetical protein
MNYKGIIVAVAGKALFVWLLLTFGLSWLPALAWDDIEREAVAMQESRTHMAQDGIDGRQ